MAFGGHGWHYGLTFTIFRRPMAKGPLPIKRIRLQSGAKAFDCSREKEPVLFYSDPQQDLLAPWPARSRWRLSDGSLGRFYGDQLFLAIRAVQQSDSTVQVELPLSAYLAELGRDPHTYISEIRFPEQGDDEEGNDSKHHQLLDDVGPALPMLKLPRDGGAYAYIRESQKHRVHAPAEEHQIHADPSCKPWNPLFRWFLCGSPGSGLGCHQDPNSTMFWNACIVGKKRWCIFPPSTPETVLVSREGLPCWLPGSGTTEHPEYHPSASAKAWFEQEYERVRSLHCNAQRSGAAAGIGMVEFIQCEGEVVVCPAGWWHIVLVLEPSVTFTENWLADRDIGSALGLLKAAPWQAKILWHSLPWHKKLRAFFGHSLFRLQAAARKIQERGSRR
eukprot:s4842_g3.t1